MARGTLHLIGMVPGRSSMLISRNCFSHNISSRQIATWYEKTRINKGRNSPALFLGIIGLLHLIQGQHCGPKCTNNLRFGMNIEPCIQRGFQRFHNADILGHAAGHDNLTGNTT